VQAFIWCDGAAERPEPGPAGAGYVIVAQGQGLARSVPLGHQTNHTAEYQAVVLALRAAADMGISRVHLRTDSQTVVVHYRDPKTCKSPPLKALLAQVKEQVKRIEGGVTFELISRKKNGVADRLALDARRSSASGT
jgi:ribonuclease HI